MMDEIKSYKTLTNMFSKAPISENEKNDFPSICNALESLDTAKVEKSKEANEEIEPTGVNDSFEEVSSDSEKGKEVSEEVEKTLHEPDLDDYNFFKRQDSMELNMFFNHHPIVPKSQKGLPFKIDKAFKQENESNRIWLTYSFSKKALFCSVCLAFENRETSSFNSECGMKDWKHVYQRIYEHEQTTVHGNNCDLYFMHFKNRTIDKLLFNQYAHKRNQQVTNNQQILDIIINVIKFIDKTGLSYRGNLNEAAYSLENENIDHGNFLEILVVI
ncbi:zinc finger MYM-type protein 5-like [Mycetomoellerius zeteki]|uniref:zinc finger MYM-type protein 5-like n=1 Tax=Mycetomoellerius zeteki TaxID=64791 RepID=UPI00084EC2FA|nr:PREDICTED: zinc finger MYM-type protein 5-like [Trachymyrmex zeteki]